MDQSLTMRPCAFAAPAAAAATAWPRPRSCESNARPFRVGAGDTAVAASRPKMNETVAAAAKMLLALLDLDFLGLRGAASDAGIVLSVTGIVSVAVNRNVAEEFVWSFYAVLSTMPRSSA